MPDFGIIQKLLGQLGEQSADGFTGVDDLGHHVAGVASATGIQNIFLALEHFFKINRDAAARAKQIDLKDKQAARFFTYVEHMLQGGVG